MAKTLAEKILSKHSGKDLTAGDYAVCAVDFMLATDATAPIAIKSWREMGGEQISHPEKMVLVLDHATPCPNQKIAALHSLMRSFAAEHAIKLYEVGDGVCHQLVLEDRLVKAGELVLGADSHTCTYGALGAMSCGVGATDLAATMLTGKSWFRVPETIRIDLTGNFAPHVYAKDVILHIVGQLGSNGALYKSVEFYGEILDELELSSKATLCNMAVEMGAKNCFICDATTNISSDHDALFSETIQIDLSTIAPMVAKPHTVDNVEQVQSLEKTIINQGFIGSCTNGSLADLKIAANILSGGKIASGVRLLVSPASKKILIAAIKDGTIEILLDAGATLLTPGCGPCVGTHNGIPGDGENVISSTNRNFTGRMGNNKANVYLASPATVAASVLAGWITSSGEANL